jgi:hypothetical protein
MRVRGQLRPAPPCGRSAPGGAARPSPTPALAAAPAAVSAHHWFHAKVPALQHTKSRAPLYTALTGPGSSCAAGGGGPGGEEGEGGRRLAARRIAPHEPRRCASPSRLRYVAGGLASSCRAQRTKPVLAHAPTKPPRQDPYVLQSPPADSPPGHASLIKKLPSPPPLLTVLMSAAPCRAQLINPRPAAARAPSRHAPG